MTTSIKLEALAAGGDAVGRMPGGKTVFVPRGAPGDVVVVEPVSERKKVCFADIVQVISASPRRVQPRCRYFDSGRPTTSCGGCDWQHLEPTLQAETKRSIVCDALQRIGGIAAAENLVCATVTSPLVYSYRNKADFVVGGSGEFGQMGFFAKRSHQIIDIDECPIQQAPNNAIMQAVREAMTQGLVEPFSPLTGKGVLRRLVARTSNSGQLLACAVTTAAHWPQEVAFARALRERLPALVGVLRRKPRQSATLLQDGSGDARAWLEEEVHGFKLRASGEAFFQINSSIVPALFQTVMATARITPGVRVLDLYCGVGLFSLGLARAGGIVTGFERSQPSIADAKFNARTNRLDVEFITTDVAAALRDGRYAGNRPSVIVLDPPRAGASDALAGVIALRPDRIVYVSCEPATLARDVSILSQNGFRLQSVVPMDLFPQTAHVEAVAELVLT